MHKKITLIIILLLNIVSYEVFSQGFGPWETLYKENGLTVEVQFKIDNSSCSNSKKNKIQYRVNGKLSSFDYYLIWTTDYINCSGKTIYQEHSLNLSSGNPLANASTEALGDTWPSQEDEFLAENIITKFYDVHTSSYSSKKSGVKINLKSVLPDAIEGNPYVFYGNSTELSVKSGSLGSGAYWVWYSGSCAGTPVGSGSSITVSPTSTTTYFVRAESAIAKSNCIEKTVQIISKSPDEILGNTEIFEGEETELSIKGGILMPNANWVWYENYNKIGTGISVKVKPTKNTEYYVRAESPNGVSLNVKVNVIVKSNAPTSILGEESIVFGDSTELTVDGGFLLPNQNYVWYEEKIGGNKVGAGASITVMPLETTVYYVRAEGAGINSGHIYTIVTVEEPAELLVKKNIPAITNVDFSNNNDRIEITFDITNSLPSDRFLVSISGFKKNSDRLNVYTIAGDTSKIKGGNSKKIIWDSKKDGYDFNEKIYFNITAKKELNIPFGSHVVKSLIFPGWGDLKLRTNKKSSLLIGIGGFALAAGSIVLNQQAKQSYKSYENSILLEESTKYYNDANSKRNLSRIVALSASLVWTIDLAGLYYNYNKIKKNPTEENCPYYYSRSQQVLNSNSKLQLINTKNQ